MNKAAVAIIIIAILGLAAALFFTQNAPLPVRQTAPNSATNMLLTSPSFENNGFIPAKFTCDGSTSLTTGGGDINPELHIQNAPGNVKSLVLIMDDPDAPGGTFTHWLVWNIDPKTSVIKQESKPPGSVEGKTDFGRAGYGGPCPPSGTHRYFFKLYALNAILDLTAGSGKAELEKAMDGRILSKTELIGLYQRK